MCFKQLPSWVFLWREWLLSVPPTLPHLPCWPFLIIRMKWPQWWKSLWYFRRTSTGRPPPLVKNTSSVSGPGRLPCPIWMANLFVGIIPSSFTAANISIYTGYVYDAFQALARGLNIMEQNATTRITNTSGWELKKRYCGPRSLWRRHLDNCSLSGRTKAGSYGYGDRVERIPYLIVNINNATFTRGGNLFRTIGYFDANMLYCILCVTHR